ncbi:hypothetical protein KEM52_000744 [Ascosphaera acerosa]|nr:hypothetical protein KEM52_000744 [Ascosphaera acerosa]
MCPMDEDWEEQEQAQGPSEGDEAGSESSGGSSVVPELDEDILRMPAPSISQHFKPLLAGRSYAHYSPVPPGITTLPASHAEAPATECVLGIDEAGRGPVLGPMVYSAFYLPTADQDDLLRSPRHRFDDSKVLSPAVRAWLFEKIYTEGHRLWEKCGWATNLLSARDISAKMLAPGGPNLNEQAMQATVELIRHIVEDLGVNVGEVFIDTIGNPATYQRKLNVIFPALKITVAKKADSLYPCVSAASVCAKVTRDDALSVFESMRPDNGVAAAEDSWGSGYPSDPKCARWLRNDIHPVFGWGHECRFSWGTAKELLEDGKHAIEVEWPEDAQTKHARLCYGIGGKKKPSGALEEWYGERVRKPI